MISQNKIFVDFHLDKRSGICFIRNGGRRLNYLQVKILNFLYKPFKRSHFSRNALKRTTHSYEETKIEFINDT